MIRDRKHETMPREKLQQLQGERLAALVARLYSSVPLYKERMDEAGLDPKAVKGLEDIQKLPFTYKTDLRDTYPFGMFAKPLKEIVRIHASSGTTGKPTTVGYTRGDIDTWAEVMARTLAGAGATDEDVLQNAYGYGLFTGGLGAHYGGERLGASVIPISGGNTQKQLMLMQDYKSTVLCATPSFALYIHEVAEDMGISIADLPLRIGVLGAEPWSETMRKEIEEKLNIKAMDIYGLSEIIGPGVSGRTTARMQRVSGRSDDMLIIRGVNVFPTQVESVLLMSPEVAPHYHLLVDRQGSMDTLGVEVEVTSAVYEEAQNAILSVEDATVFQEHEALAKLKKKIRGDIKDIVGVTVDLEFKAPGSIERSEGKSQRVVDRRKA